MRFVSMQDTPTEKTKASKPASPRYEMGLLRIFSRILQLKPSINSNRNELLDFMKGAAMLLVLLHHSRFPFGSYILAFHMPLFFVISGYMKKTTAKEQPQFGKFLWARFKRLIIPYLLFEAVNLLAWFAYCTISKTDFSWGISLLSIVTCINNSYMGLYGRLWFLPCIFVAEVFMYFIVKLTKKDHIATGTMGILCFFSSWLVTTLIGKRLLFTLDTALMATGFMVVGYLGCSVFRCIIDNRKKLWILVLSSICVLYIVYGVRSGRAVMLMYNCEFGEYTVTIATALAGCAAFFCYISLIYDVVGKLPVLKNVALWYGRNSLVVFPIHLTIKVFALRVFRPANHWFVLAVLMLVFSIPIGNFITAYLPIMAGVHKQKQKDTGQPMSPWSTG